MLDVLRTDTQTLTGFQPFLRFWLLLWREGVVVRVTLDVSTLLEILESY